jgi:kinesin family protein C2/C3
MAINGPVGFQVRLGEDWLDYPDACSKTILAAYEAGEKKANFVLGIDGKSVPMYIDFEEMTQVSVFSKRSYPVRQPFDFLKPKEDDDAFDDVEQEEYKGQGDQNVAKARKLVQKIMNATKDFKTEKDGPKMEEWRTEINNLIKEVIKMGLAEKEVLPCRDRLRKVHNAVQDLKGAIRVYARTRPLNQREKDNMSKLCFEFEKDNMHVKMADEDGNTNRYTFDTTFNPGTQKEVFSELEDLIQSVYDGFNVTVFAYGQTGAGKTYTMYGPQPDPRKDSGVVLSSIDKVFQLREEFGKQYSTGVALSMVELYNSKITDLLASDVMKAPQINVRKANDGEVVLEGSEFHECNTTSEAWDLIQKAFTNRKVAATAMNAESSRSHLILRVQCRIHNLKSGQELKGKLIMVDLAGSERVKNSQVEGDNLKEAIEINKSLTALGDVMEKLTQGSKNAGYRNHLLTQVLADSLGGTAKTLMFANLSPASVCFGETKMTCEWATRARKVTNDKGGDDKKGGGDDKPKPKKKIAVRK